MAQQATTQRQLREIARLTNNTNRTLAAYLAGEFGPGWRIEYETATHTVARGPVSAAYPHYGEQRGFFPRGCGGAHFERIAA